MPPTPPLTDEHFAVTALKGISEQLVNDTPPELTRTFHVRAVDPPVIVQSTAPAPVTGAASGSVRLKFTVTGEVDVPVIPDTSGSTNACLDGDAFVGGFELRLTTAGGPANPGSRLRTIASETVMNMGEVAC